MNGLFSSRICLGFSCSAAKTLLMFHAASLSSRFCAFHDFLLVLHPLLHQKEHCTWLHHVCFKQFQKMQFSVLLAYTVALWNCNCVATMIQFVIDVVLPLWMSDICYAFSETENLVLIQVALHATWNILAVNEKSVYVREINFETEWFQSFPIRRNLDANVRKWYQNCSEIIL